MFRSKHEGFQLRNDTNYASYELTNDVSYNEYASGGLLLLVSGPHRQNTMLLKRDQ